MDMEIKLKLNLRKYEALKISMTEKLLDPEGEILLYMDRLYKKYIPEEKRREIENRIEQDRRDEIRKSKMFSVVHLHSECDDYYFATKHSLDLYELSRIYKNYVRGSEKVYTLDSLAYYFGEHDMISELAFSSLCGAIKADDKISVAVRFDFEKDWLSVCDSLSGKWRDYRLKDITAAIAEAGQGTAGSQAEKQAIFKKLIAGKESVQSDENEASELNAPVMRL